MFVIREPMIGISPLKDEKKELGRIEGVKSLYTIQSFDEKTAGIAGNADKDQKERESGYRAERGEHPDPEHVPG